MPKFIQRDLERMRLLDRPKQTYKESTEDTTANRELLDIGRGYWTSLANVRERRRVCRNFLLGYQWDEFVQDPEGNGMVQEKELIARDGHVPLKQNIIYSTVNNLIGQFRSAPGKPIVFATDPEKAKEAEMMSNMLQAVQNDNEQIELDVAAVFEFALSGILMQKNSYIYDRLKDRPSIKSKNPNATRIFFNSDVRDPRMEDLKLVGEIHDLDIEEILSDQAFCASPKDEERIRGWYPHLVKEMYDDEERLTKDREDIIDFMVPTDTHKCRVFEIWYMDSRWVTIEHDMLRGELNITDRSLKEVREDNEEFMRFARDNGVAPEEIKPYIKATRKKELIWRVKFLTPTYHTLWEGDTVYDHQEHPYTIRMSPLIDGEVHGFVWPMIDQQKYINRNIILLDFLVKNAGKNLLIFPESAKPTGWTDEDIILESRKSNGVIFAKIRPGAQLPVWLSSAAHNVGIHDMIRYQLQFLSEVSGIHGAMKGAAPTAGTPAVRYAEEAHNSSVNILDFMAKIRAWRKARNYKQITLIQQFFDKEQYIDVAGSNYADTVRMWRPKDIQDVKFTTDISVSSDSPTYDYMASNSLLEMAKLYPQEITLEMLLENSTFPYSSQMLEALRKRRAMAEQGQQPEAIDPALVAAAQQELPVNENFPLIQQALQ